MNELDLLRSVDPAGANVPLHHREEILQAVRASAPRRTRGRRQRTVIGLVAGAVTLGSGGLAFAVLSGQPAATALKINCASDPNDALEFNKQGVYTDVIDVSSGDPVADCAAEFARRGEPAPALRAYSSGSVFVWVVPAEWKVPTSWQPLATNFRSDTVRLTLKHRVEDPVDGPGAGCKSTIAVHDAVVSELATLHMEGWTIKPAPGAASGDGQANCAFAFLDEEGTKTIYLQAGPPLSPADLQADHAYEGLKTQLRQNIAERCLTMSQAKTAAEEALSSNRLKGTVLAASTSAGRCTAVDLIPAGVFTVDLY
jgi:hypothetical protein